MSQHVEHRLPGPTPETLTDRQVDLQALAERARELRARYMWQFVKSAFRVVARVAAGKGKRPAGAANRGASLTPSTVVLAPSRQPAYRG